MTVDVASSLGPDPQRPVGLVLSGGGARGAFQVGVWEVLRNDPRGFGGAPLVISGTSAGALNGALIAAGLAPHEMLEFWLDLADNPPVIANDVFFRSLEKVLTSLTWREPLRSVDRRLREVRIGFGLFRKHRFYARSGIFAMLFEFLLTARFDTVSQLMDGIETSYLFDTAPLRERLRRAIGGTELRNTKVRLAINTVDVKTGSVVRIVNYRPEKSPRASSKHYRYEPSISLDMIMASASIPLIFNPVCIDGQELWDGGLLVNSPMAPVVALGAQRIVPVLCTLRDIPTRGNLTSFGMAVERLVDAILENAYNIDRKLLLDRNALADRLPDHDLTVVQLFRAIRPQSATLFNAGSYLHFERKQLLAVYEAGREAARAWLARGPEVDSREIED
jgi:predicted acylesterase/phospholipase RssA